MPNLDELLHNPLMWWLAAGSVVTFIATLVLVPWLVVRLPPDYFDHEIRRAAKPTDSGSRLGYWLVLGIKNVAGAMFILMGIAMIVLPGQGLLTILIGLSLINFPGKYRMERYIVTRPIVLSGLNWLRRRTGQAPFQFSNPAISRCDVGAGN